MSGLASAVIVPLAPEHAGQVLAIYQAGIDDGNATFETVAPTWKAFDAAKLPEHRFAALDESGAVLGWVDDPVGDLPRERRQRRCSPAGRLPCHRHAEADRAPSRRLGDVVLVERRSPAIT